MDEEVFNMSVRKFLKKVGVTSQREIEQAIRDSGIAGGKVPVEAVIRIPGLEREVVISGEIELE